MKTTFIGVQSVSKTPFDIRITFILPNSNFETPFPETVISQHKTEPPKDDDNDAGDNGTMSSIAPLFAHRILIRTHRRQCLHSNEPLIFQFRSLRPHRPLRCVARESEKSTHLVCCSACKPAGRWFIERGQTRSADHRTKSPPSSGSTAAAEFSEVSHVFPCALLIRMPDHSQDSFMVLVRTQPAGRRWWSFVVCLFVSAVRKCFALMFLACPESAKRHE